MTRTLKRKPAKAPRERAPSCADDKEQSKLFIEKAREIGAEEESSAADELLWHLHKKPPEPRKKR